MRQTNRPDHRFHSPLAITSPLQPPVATSRTERMYSFEEVRSWCEDMLECRLKFLILQINENNETIRQLKERLLSN